MPVATSHDSSAVLDLADIKGRIGSRLRAWSPSARRMRRRTEEVRACDPAPHRIGHRGGVGPGRGQACRGDGGEADADTGDEANRRGGAGGAQQ